jgi:hypothetical protein
MIETRKTLLAATLGAMILTGVAHAQNSRSYWGWSQQSGSSTYTTLYGSDGSYISGRIWRLGNSLYYDLRADTGTTVSGSSYQLGSFELYNITVRRSILTSSSRWLW